MNSRTDFSSEYSIKLRYIMLRFILLVIVTTVGLAAFRYIFDIHYHLIRVDEDSWEMLMPSTLVVVVLIIWFRPMMRIMNFKKSKDWKNPLMVYYFVAGGTMFASLVSSQEYLTTSTGRLETLRTITDIDAKEKVRYYRINDFIVDPQHVGKYLKYGNSSGRISTFNMDYYVVLPILLHPHEDPTITHKYWYGIKFQKNLRGRVKESDMGYYLNKFCEECARDLRGYNYYGANYFEYKPLSEDHKHFNESLATLIGDHQADDYIFLTPVFKPFDQHNGTNFEWIFYSLGIGIAIMLVLLVRGSVNETELYNLKNGIRAKDDTVRDILLYLIPSGNHFITSILLDINILVFFIMILSGVDITSPSGADMLHWGGDRRDDVLSGEWWRLFTSMFVHAGIVHIAMNILALGFAAVFVEPVLGRRHYLFLYILSGLGGSLASIYWHVSTVSVGASGAIFGIFGAIIGLALVDAYPRAHKLYILGTIGFYIVINLIWGMVGDVDNAAHIGGLVTGLVFGMLLFKLDRGSVGYTPSEIQEDD